MGLFRIALIELSVGAALQIVPVATLTAQTQSIRCSTTLNGRDDAATNELCLAAQQVQLAQSTQRGTPEWRGHLEDGIRHYRTAANRADGDAKLQALKNLVRLYGAAYLNDPTSLESVLQELVVAAPDDIGLMFQLARAQEAQGNADSAESTLLLVRHMHPDDVQPNKMLAQFYSRRIAVLQQDPNKQPPRQTRPGEADENGVYQVGRDIPPPTRVKKTSAIYPQEALAAGVEGAVSVDVVIDPSGRVVDAQIRRSVPLLDDAAIQAVRTWQYAPTIIKGQAVPVRMTVLIPFQRPH